MTIARLALCGVLLGFIGTFGSAAAFAEEMSQEEMIQSLQAKPATRGLTRGLGGATAAPAANLSKEMNKLRTTRQITVEERKKISDTVKESGLPAIDVEVFFDYDSAAITQKAMPDLVRLGEVLSDGRLDGGIFLLAGHTDAAGGAEYNLGLSGRRADSVKAFLIEHFDIDPKRLVTVGFGFEDLKDPRDPFSGVNRRVQVINVESANVAEN
jgi:outer membrane protein OmpA-like peptidoglycan-associated protein